MPKVVRRWIALALLLSMFLGYLAWLHPASYFGRYHDDTIYFTTAQALAQGRGPVMPSLPGSPRETKYPLLYPWLLSWVWRWNPSFPANLTAAVCMTAAFACWFLAASFLLLRKFAGVGDWVALGAVALTAFEPRFLFVSGVLLSDMPFMALAMTAALLADDAFERRGGGRPAIAAGVAVGLAMLVRSLGAAVGAGIAAAALLRGKWRWAVIFAASAAPFAVFGFLQSLENSGAVAQAAGGGSGWRQTWLYYTSYGAFWRLSVPSLQVFRTMLAANVRFFLVQPATFCLFPPVGSSDSYLGGILSMTLSVGILAGIFRQARSDRFRPVHFIFLFYSVAILFWNFPLMDRFLLLFLPLFYVGLWAEGKHLISMLIGALRSNQPAAEKALAGVMLLAVAAAGASAARSYLGGVRPQLRAAAEEGRTLAPEKAEAYDWIRQHTGLSTRFIAYNDTSIYLQTGRQAMRPFAFTTEAFYLKNEEMLEDNLCHFLDVARHIGAGYWLSSGDDFRLETGIPLIEKRAAQLQEILPVSFESSKGKVRVYDLTCVHDTSSPRCRPLQAVLFPRGVP